MYTLIKTNLDIWVATCPSGTYMSSNIHDCLDWLRPMYPIN